ncbi:short-subunit dehydrogenase [Thermosporothrix hazakensis]|jgi:short-subunit dehydrogenase|uniref:Short-subunit dehydrogenase n=2 Tax=Thermosporothrix TaxID=768650 RepID=A0A326UIJ7_THEHA|nr:SDR family oxidoreductase [Thermosporothrix hazakensis]PZW36620.1 short-subunit dehydrogenase [Thermosporothrix hazakensis]GCE47271.1 short-chain dehydrogenase [Thermosporothrix hazakensis]
MGKEDMTKLVIVGATSAIAQETAKCFARDGAELFLVARNRERLEILAADLRIRGAQRVELFELDVLDFERHQEMLDTAIETLKGFDMLLIAHGTLGNQRACEASVEETFEELKRNALSVISLLTISSNYFERRRKGVIAVISSVAGDRGRRSNYVYGTAKGAVSLFLQGLRGRLAKAGVAVVTIKPGFVDTPMTAHMRKGLLFAKPSTVGEDVYRAMKKRKEVVYTPWFWRYIMLIVRAIPERLFKYLSF